MCEYNHLRTNKVSEMSILTSLSYSHGRKVFVQLSGGDHPEWVVDGESAPLTDDREIVGLYPLLFPCFHQYHFVSRH